MRVSKSFLIIIKIIAAILAVNLAVVSGWFLDIAIVSHTVKSSSSYENFGPLIVIIFLLLPCIAISGVFIYFVLFSLIGKIFKDRDEVLNQQKEIVKPKPKGPNLLVVGLISFPLAILNSISTALLIWDILFNHVLAITPVTQTVTSNTNLNYYGSYVNQFWFGLFFNSILFTILFLVFVFVYFTLIRSIFSHRGNLKINIICFILLICFIPVMFTLFSFDMNNQVTNYLGYNKNNPKGPQITYESYADIKGLGFLCNVRSRFRSLYSANLNPVSVCELDLTNDANLDAVSVSNFQNLVDLKLDGSSFTLLPKEIGNDKKLRGINLLNTGLEELPDEITTLPNLEELTLTSNKNLKKLPSNIDNLAKLDILVVSDSGIRDFPSTSGLSNLSYLDLSADRFEKFPASVTKLKNLKIFVFKGNSLSFPIEITEMKIKYLNLALSNITEVPSEISKMTGLEELDLSNNPIKSLPPEISRLNKLQILKLYGTKIKKKEADKIKELLPNVNIYFKED